MYKFRSMKLHDEEKRNINGPLKMTLGSQDLVHLLEEQVLMNYPNYSIY